MKIMGLSCKISLKLIQWHRQPGHGRSGRRRLEPRLSRGRGSLRGADAQVQGMIIGMGENLRPKRQQIGLYIVVYFWLWSYLIVDWCLDFSIKNRCNKSRNQSIINDFWYVFWGSWLQRWTVSNVVDPTHSVCWQRWASGALESTVLFMGVSICKSISLMVRNWWSIVVNNG
jgi:hypothetical protein